MIVTKLSNRHRTALDRIEVYGHCPSCGAVKKVSVAIDGNKFIYWVACSCYRARSDTIRWVIDPMLTPGLRGSLTTRSASVWAQAEALWAACQMYADYIRTHYEPASCRCTLEKLMETPGIVLTDPRTLLACMPRTPLSPGLLQWLDLAR